MDALGVLVPVVEACGAVVIVVGALWAFVPVRLTPGRFSALGLESQLASDVLRTAVAPGSAPRPGRTARAASRTCAGWCARPGAPEPDSVRRGSITHGQDARAGVDGRGRPRVDS